MNFTIEFLSSSSSFLRVDMERYPSEISKYCSGDFVLRDPLSAFLSESNAANICSTSKVSKISWYPNEERVVRILTSFSVRSRISRERESDCLSKLLISFVTVFSPSYKSFSFASYSLNAETDVPEVD